MAAEEEGKAAGWKTMMDRKLCIRSYRVPSGKLNGRIRAVFLSDLHGSCYGNGQEELLKLVCQAEPDVVFFGGDMADEKLSAEPANLVMKTCQAFLKMSSKRLMMSTGSAGAYSNSKFIFGYHN